MIEYDDNAIGFLVFSFLFFFFYVHLYIVHVLQHSVSVVLRQLKYSL